MPCLGRTRRSAWTYLGQPSSDGRRRLDPGRAPSRRAPSPHAEPMLGARISQRVVRWQWRVAPAFAGRNLTVPPKPVRTEPSPDLRPPSPIGWERAGVRAPLKFWWYFEVAPGARGRNLAVPPLGVPRLRGPGGGLHQSRLKPELQAGSRQSLGGTVRLRPRDRGRAEKWGRDPARRARGQAAPAPAALHAFAPCAESFRWILWATGGILSP